MGKSLITADPGIQNNLSRIRMKSRMKMIYRDRFLYLLALPGLLFFLVFKYVPMWGLGHCFSELLAVHRDYEE